MDLVQELGELALGARLRRLADRLQQDVSQIYSEQEEEFRARCFPLLVALSREAPRSVTGLASSLGLTHTAIHQMAVQMTSQELLVTERDPADKRRRLLSLSPRGKRTVERLKPLWGEIAAATEDLLESAGHPLLSALGAIEQRLDERTMYQRIRDRRTIEIVDFQPRHAEPFRSLNRVWLEEWFEVEESDLLLLNDPDGQVLALGGAILCAVEEEEVVGVCALCRHSDARFELTKMAVAAEHRRRGIGRRLGQAAIERASQLGGRQIFLLTSPRLEAALALYRCLGFTPLPQLPTGLVKLRRPSVAFGLELHRKNPSGELG